MLGSEQAARIRNFDFHGGRCHNHNDARPSEPSLRHGKSSRHYHIGELDRPPWRTRLNDLSKTERAATKNLAAPVARLYLRQVEGGLLPLGSWHLARPSGFAVHGNSDATLVWPESDASSHRGRFSFRPICRR